MPTPSLVTRMTLNQVLLGPRRMQAGTPRVGHVSAATHSTVLRQPSSVPSDLATPRGGEEHSERKDPGPGEQGCVFSARMSCVGQTAAPAGSQPGNEGMWSCPHAVPVGLRVQSWAKEGVRSFDLQVGPALRAPAAPAMPQLSP